jgi:(4-(4-[2-(gamma-L-glutamylamino)ethyl]phenoxymethyl)furan-2-yl)methanamine synthase
MSKTLSKPQFMLGWDIGGAHLKAVLLDTKGNYIASSQLPCPLWRGLEYLERAIHEVQFIMRKNIGLYNVTHAITMTGEMVDLFESRHEGVCKIAKLASKLLGENCYFYAADAEAEHGFVRALDVPRFASVIASANWHASATFLGKHVPNALLIDIGSTTSDIIPIIDGNIALNGHSDVARLKNGSLVYTGVVRTPIMALAQKLPFFDGDEHIEINVMAELFATTADVYRLTGELKKDDAETADGKGKTQLESARRLARMIGYDVHDNLERWIQLAFNCKNLQMYQLKTAIAQHLKPNMIIIGAGAGSFLAKQIAEELNCEFKHACEPISMRISRMNNQLQLVYSAVMPRTGTEHASLTVQQDIEVCFPAYAVAYLRVKF